LSFALLNLEENLWSGGRLFVLFACLDSFSLAILSSAFRVYAEIPEVLLRCSLALEASLYLRLCLLQNNREAETRNCPHISPLNLDSPASPLCPLLPSRFCELLASRTILGSFFPSRPSFFFLQLLIAHVLALLFRSFLLIG